jgi:geranylgeranyl pyrophosphate synthase
VSAALPEGDWLASERTRAALGMLDATLRSAVHPRDAQFRVMAFHLVQRRGKRLRPALVLLAGEFGQFVLRRLLRGAAAVELLHIASLYHDDVMDHAGSRRGGDTVNARWGNSAAVLAGTYLFAKAVGLIAEMGAEATRLTAAAIDGLCTGQLCEMESAFDTGLTEAEHLEVIERKTASLFELPCRLGANLAGCSEETIESLGAYGRHLGVAFQLADDALDFVGDADTLGKDPRADLPKGAYSLPVLRALRGPGSGGEQLRDLLGRLRPTRGELDQAVELVRTSGAVEEALGLARDRADLAVRALSVLPDGSPRTSLEALAAFAVKRRT